MRHARMLVGRYRIHAHAHEPLYRRSSTDRRFVERMDPPHFDMCTRATRALRMRVRPIPPRRVRHPVRHGRNLLAPHIRAQHAPLLNTSL